MAPETTAGPPVWGRVRTIVFYASLALNILIIGVILGAIAFGGRGAPRGAIEGQVPMLRALSQDERRDFVRAVRGDREDRRAARAAAGQRAQQMLQVLRAEPFDAVAFETLMAGQSDVAQRRAETGRSALIQVLRDMDPTERRAYASRLEEEFRRTAKDRRSPRADAQ